MKVLSMNYVNGKLFFSKLAHQNSIDGPSLELTKPLKA